VKLDVPPLERGAKPIGSPAQYVQVVVCTSFWVICKALILEHMAIFVTGSRPASTPLT